MMTDTIEDLYDMMEDIGTAMLVTDVKGQLRSRPMRGKIYRSTGEIWFLSSATSGKVDEIISDGDANLSYACPEKASYISISGKAYLSRDPEKIDDLWGPWAKAWLQCEKTSPDVVAIRFDPSVAEYWDGTSSKVLQTWELLKANLTGDKPDMGENETVAL